MGRCKETKVDKRVISCQWEEHKIYAVVEDGKLEYMSCDDSDIQFHSLFPCVYIPEVNAKTIDTLLGFLVSIKYALED